jgi:hypothetical protein
MPDRSPSPPLVDHRSHSPPPIGPSNRSIVHRKEKIFALPNFGPNSLTYSKFQKSNLEYDAVFGPKFDSDMTPSMKKYYQNKTFEPTQSPSRRQSEISRKNTDQTLKKTSTCYPKVPKFPKPDPPEPFAFSSYELSNISPPTHPKFKFKSHSNIASLMAQKLKIKRLNLSQPNPQKSNRVHLLSAYTSQTHPNNPFSLLNLNKSTHQFFGSNGKGVTG